MSEDLTSASASPPRAPTDVVEEEEEMRSKYF